MTDAIDTVAMYREVAGKDVDLCIEIHRRLTPAEAIVLGKGIEKFYEYELPKELVGIIWKGKYRGQKQKWFIVRFTGSESEINLKTKNPEFIEWKWIAPDELPNVIVKFKKKMYLELLKDIKEVIG